MNNISTIVELQRLTTFEGLKVGDKVTHITYSGFKSFEFMGFDPQLANDKYKYNYAFFLDSFGRTKTERWYIDKLQKEEIYKGYDTLFVKIKECNMLRSRLLDKRKDIPFELYYAFDNADLKLKLEDIIQIQFHSDVVMGETLGSIPADGLTLEEAFELYITSMGRAEGDRFYRQTEESDEMEEL